jgi:hypothetical protein
MMLGTLGSQTWVYTRSNTYASNEDSDAYNAIVYFSSFEGNLYSCLKSCDKSYKYLRDEWCDFEDEFDSLEEYIDVQSYATYTFGYEAKTLCSTFKSLYTSMIFYLVIESFSICLMIAWLLCIIISTRIKSAFMIFISIILSFLSSCLHIGVFIAYMVITRTNFNLNCKYFPFHSGNQMNLCAGDGPGLALFISILLPIVTFSFAGVSLTFHRRRLSKVKAKQEIQLN